MYAIPFILFEKKKISVRLLLTRMHKYTSYAYYTQLLGPEYVKVNCTIEMTQLTLTVDSRAQSPYSMLQFTCT